MRKLNGKNKFFILIFVVVVLGIAGIITGAVYLVSKNATVTDYDISETDVVFDSETNLVDTSNGGAIGKKWSSEYYFTSANGASSELGEHPVVYNKNTEEIDIFGTNYQVDEDGDVKTNKDITKIAKSALPTFYKLDDRMYLIIAGEISSSDQAIYASTYLIVYIDKQGNASLLNDAINVKTINPMTLTFDEFVFDIANEKLVAGKKTVDLKLIQGSTNEYVEKVEEKDPVEDVEKGVTELISAYNGLVSDFTMYSNAANANAAATNQINATYIVSNSSSGAGEKVVNNVEISKRVSLRGVVSHPTMIDVTYLVTDPEEKYQAVYLEVTGKVNGMYGTYTYYLDKYETTYRVSGLSPKNQYSIRLGYTEVSYTSDDGKVLTDEIEDEINVRTTKNDMSLSVTKVTDEYIYYNFKMTEEFAVSSGVVRLYSANGVLLGSDNVNVTQALTDGGYSGKIKKTTGSEVYTLKLEDAFYAGALVDTGLTKSFVVPAT